MSSTAGILAGIARAARKKKIACVLRFPGQFYFKRTNSRRWVEASCEEALGSKYEDHVTASALVMGMAENR